MGDLTILTSVPGLFLTSVRYFELVRLGRGFKEDFGSSALLLRSTEFRLRRWGKAVGITDKESAAFLAAAQGRSKADLELVDDNVELIHDLLEHAREVTEKYAAKTRSRSTPEQASIELDTIDEDLPATADDSRESRAVVRLRSRVGVAYRQAVATGDNVQKSTRWALYKKTELTDLLKKVSEHVAVLENHFPGRLQEISQADAARLLVEDDGRQAPREEVETIIGAAATTDPNFSQALKNEAVRSGHDYQGATIRGYARARWGDDYAMIPEGGVGSSHNFTNTVAEGNSRLHAGNRYGYAEDSAVIKQAERFAREADPENHA